MDKLPPNPDPTPDLIKWIIGGIGATAIVGTIIFLLLKPSSEPEPNPNKTISYAKAVNMLHDTQTASEGIKALQALASSGNYDAAYLLSKLYFDPKYQKTEWDNIPDSIFILKGLSNIKPDYQESKKLLEKAVSINPNDCNSLYDLGIEYLIGDRKTLEGRKTEESEKYLSHALKNAKDTQDQKLIQAIEKLGEEYNLNLIKEGR
ncbi:tetratricopeptide repeat protein [Bacteroides rodentium]|uniref:tetratricopeptide repeat protein n=1 Tax=Bacteroides rodentium TaxID=691816 RepID=UPI0010084936|nr:hypothetical protein [Bacteroides rodentium]